ncbi:transposable element Tcb1 transposase [Trichonephila clavipes]|nr:transposable element Tcb1 transposase [Trichonephila clavipes]
MKTVSVDKVKAMRQHPKQILFPETVQKYVSASYASTVSLDSAKICVSILCKDSFLRQCTDMRQHPMQGQFPKTELFKKGKSYSEIAKIVGRSHSCVQKFIGRFRSDGLIENKSGRKSILSDVAKRKVLKDIKINPKLSAVHHPVWRKPNTALDPKKLRPTVKHGGGSVMVCGCMASNGVGNLAFIDGIMDHKLYIDILNNNLKESAKKLGLDGNFISQQDNDPKHTARNVKMCCLFHCKQQLHTPPQSPHINVIKNLWPTLETAVQKHQIRNKAHLKQVLQEEWDKLSPDTTKKLVESVPRRLEDIIKAKGHATKHRHCLSIAISPSGRGSRVVKVSDRCWSCYEFEPSTTKDPQCRGAMHVKSVESSNVLPLLLVVVRRGDAGSGVAHVT